MNEQKLLSTQNLEDGFVDVEVEQLDGSKITLRMRAPGWRKRRELILDFQRSYDVFLFLQECLGSMADGRLEFLLDKLTPDSVARLENYATALVLGESYQKKMAEAGREVIQKMITANG